MGLVITAQTLPSTLIEHLDSIIFFSYPPFLHASLLAGMIPMPRVMWAMAEHGLLFKGLAKISLRTKTPLTAAVTSGAWAGPDLHLLTGGGPYVVCINRLN